MPKQTTLTKPGSGWTKAAVFLALDGFFWVAWLFILVAMFPAFGAALAKQGKQPGVFTAFFIQLGQDIGPQHIVLALFASVPLLGALLLLTLMRKPGTEPAAIPKKAALGLAVLWALTVLALALPAVDMKGL